MKKWRHIEVIMQLRDKIVDQNDTGFISSYVTKLITIVRHIEVICWLLLGQNSAWSGHGTGQICHYDCQDSIIMLDAYLEWKTGGGVIQYFLYFLLFFQHYHYLKKIIEKLLQHRSCTGQLSTANNRIIYLVHIHLHRVIWFSCFNFSDTQGI